MSYNKKITTVDDDSIVIPETDDESDNSRSNENYTTTNTDVIRDSDNNSYDSSNEESGDDSTSHKYTNSEEEDLHFNNTSHKVSIIDSESQSDSDEESNKNQQKQINKLKRRSIYDNPPAANTPDSSTPINTQVKRRVRNVVYSDSDDESNNELIQINDVNTSEDDKKPQGDLSPKKKSFSEEKKSSRNVIDLTINNSFNDRSIKNEVKVIHAKSDDEDNIIICDSSSTSETEIDKDVINIVKKEVGVGNIDPIEAQKKELLLVNITHIQTQLDKYHKFAASIDIDKLPDKGAKVHENIKQLEKKLMSLKEKLDKYSQKNTFNTPRKLDTSKINEKSKVKPFMEKSHISLLDDDKENEKRSTENSDIKKELNRNDSAFTNQFNDFDIHKIPNVPQTSFNADNLGKKALETLNNQQTLTNKRLEQLHGSLTSRPNDDETEKDPSGLKIPLMVHQQHALAWMKWRETQKPRGGILADDMGLGKTLTMISLILATINDEKSKDSDSSTSSEDEWISHNKHKRYYGGTLVICPASLIKQWEAEVKNRCKRGLLSVLVFHGNNRSMEDRRLSKYNIVITTYQIIVREADANSGMYRLEWNRIILDEAHYVRNHKSKACLAVCGLTAKHRWALTGTPIQNKEMDLYAILKFLKCSPFDDLHVWKRWVDNKNDAGKQRLITIMKTLMLRRTKQELQAKGSLQSLPDKCLEIIEIDLDHEENLAYQKILLFSQNLFAQFLAQRAEKHHMRELYGGKFDKPSYVSSGAKTQFTKAQKVLLEHHSSIEAHEILVLLLRLRQMCCHPALIHSMLDQQDAEVNGLDEDISSNTELLNKLQNMSITPEDEGIEDYVAEYKIDDRVAANLLTKNNPVFHSERRSSKVRAIIKTIEEIVKKGDKIIVVSQWTSFLEIVAKNLADIEDAEYAMFTGKVAVKNRQAIIDKFNDPYDDTNILLLSLTAGGVGLNLVGANHLLLIDIHWNPQLESQAQDRIYRFGQKKDVFVYKFICKDTIEERVKNLQDKKLDIANHVLTGTRSVSSKLTIDDLKLLFS